jgi:hypothetical protein
MEIESLNKTLELESLLYQERRVHFNLHFVNTESSFF